MTVSILALLVTIETFIILLGVIFFLFKKHSKLKKAFDQLMKSMAESIFSKLVEQEIDNTNERVKEITPSQSVSLDLADTSEISTDDTQSLSEEDQQIRAALNFRSAYLHAEKNAYDASDGDMPMFWLYLTENLAQLIPKAEEPEEEPEQNNEFIDEIMQELQNKLDKATESNLSLQAMLDSLLASGHLNPDQINIIKNSQADYHDLTHHISDLEQKIQNSLNLTITRQPGNAGQANDSALVIESAGNNINKEANKLKDIIFEQGNKINGLLKQLKKGTFSQNGDSELAAQLLALEKSQKETAMCIEVMEMENQRLFEQLETLQTNSSTTGSAEHETRIKELESVIEQKDHQIDQLNRELDSVQKEFMAVYQKGD